MFEIPESDNLRKRKDQVDLQTTNIPIKPIGRQKESKRYSTGKADDSTSQSHQHPFMKRQISRSEIQKF